MKGVSSVYISKAMIEMNPNLFTKDIYIGKVSGKLESVQIVSTMVIISRRICGKICVHWYSRPNMSC